MVFLLNVVMLNKEEIVSAVVNGDGNIVIQNSDNTTITIDTGNVVELRKQISNLQEQLNILNPEILQVMQQKIKDAGVDNLPSIDANVYFGIGLFVDGVSRKMGFSITITNLTKEHRYFSQPSFNLSHRYKGADSFVLMSTIGNVPSFPVRLEYGQPVTVHYVLDPNQISFLKEVFSQNEDASLAVVSSTTVGEIYRSNVHTLKYILSSYQRIVG